MTLPNEVKYKVRAIALDLETFSVAQMARVTALNPASIRTELQRMKRDGFLTSEPIRKGKSGRGAPPHLYTLTDDPQKRLALAHSIEPFNALSTASSPQPSSLHYQAAVTLAERLEAGELAAAESEKILQNAQRHLTLAAEEEGISVRSEDETAVTTAYLDLLRARLDIASGRWEQAEPHLATARQAFVDHDLDEMVARADSLLTALEVEQTLAQAPADLSLPDRLMAALGKVSGALPLPTARRMLGALRSVANLAQQLDLHPIDVNESIAAAWASLETPDGVETKIEYGANLPPVKATRQLDQVFRNLIQNALEATAHKGGALTVRSQCTGERQVAVTVQDSGPVDGPDGRDAVFAVGMPSSSNSVESELWWPRLFLRGLGGDIEVESQEDQGHILTVKLPATEAQAKLE
jgi:signal transduction histidine kinase